MNTTRESTSILDPSGLLQTSIDTAALEGLEFEPACEGSGHGAETEGHVATQSATWVIQLPCCGTAALVCAGRVEWVQAEKAAGRLDVISCVPGCGKRTPVPFVRFIPLGDI